MSGSLRYVLLSLALAACGSAPELVFSDPASLEAAYDLYAGPHTGDVELARTVKVTVDTAMQASNAESRIELLVSLARYSPADGPLAVTFLAPRDAEIVAVGARSGGQAVKVLSKERQESPLTIDPEQVGWRVTFAPIAAQKTLEAIIRLRVPGTLASDAQWLRATPTLGELLLRYDLPGDAVGAFQVVGSDARPVVTKQDGRLVIALYLKEAGAVGADAYARYTTTHASPKGYEQHFADSWAAATATYVERLIEMSDDFAADYAAPFSASGPNAAAALEAWVRERPWAANAGEGAAAHPVAWDAGRELKTPLEKNTLNAVDRVHLLHWLMKESGVPHRFAMGRLASRPALTAAFPVPDAFDVPLIAVGDTILDPGCRVCAPGAVRDELAGGQAIVLPVPASGPVELVTLPKVSVPTP